MPPGVGIPKVLSGTRSVIVARPTDLASEGSGNTASIVIVKSETATQTTTGSKSTSQIGNLASRLDETVQPIRLAKGCGLVVVIEVQTREADTTRSIAASIRKLTRRNRLAGDALWCPRLSSSTLTVAAR